MPGFWAEVCAILDNVGELRDRILHEARGRLMRREGGIAFWGCRKFPTYGLCLSNIQSPMSAWSWCLGGGAGSCTKRTSGSCTKRTAASCSCLQGHKHDNTVCSRSGTQGRSGTEGRSNPVDTFDPLSSVIQSSLGSEGWGNDNADALKEDVNPTMFINHNVACDTGAPR